MHNGFRIFIRCSDDISSIAFRQTWAFLGVAAGASQPQAAEAVVEAGRTNWVRLPRVCLGSWAACVG